jgi:heme-binding uptake protein ChaN (Tiki superfamily)
MRRNAPQLAALAGVEREIRAYDSSSRRKYLRDFTRAFRNYGSVIDLSAVKAMIRNADTILVGDYHALPASQRFMASLVEECAQPGDRPVVLALETIFARDQHIVDEWWRREIDENEFRERIRFDLDWGYDWAPFYEMLATAREFAEGLYGLDCMPREDLRKIGARDRHAAHKIAEIRERHPNALILVLFGESHLAPQHLPRALKEELPAERRLTILQNVDALYWKAAGEKHERVEAVQVNEDVVCVFNSTPLEKYENYRIHLSRWGRMDGEGPDLAPTIYNLIDTLLRFFDINRYSPHNHTQPKFLIDLLPEIYSRASSGRLHALLARKGISEEDARAIAQRAEDRGSVYLPVVNAFYVRDFQMMYAAEESARFLHHACRGLPLREKPGRLAEAADRFYVRALEHALGYFGSRVLYPARPAVEEQELRWLQLNPPPTRVKEFEASTELLGYMLGNALYDSYLQGRVKPGTLRRVLLAHLEAPGKAKELYLELAKKLKKNGR